MRLAEAEEGRGWDPVLDDLELRVVKAETGNLGALEGWAPPAARPDAMSDEQRRRASAILERQRALLVRLREEQRTVASSMRSMRRVQYHHLEAAPVYIDRVG